MVALNLHKALLFDSDKKIVKEVDFDDQLDTLYVYLNCDCVDTIRLDKSHIIFVDDEGLLKPGQQCGWIVNYKGRKVVFVGSGLLVGDNFGMTKNIDIDKLELNIQCFISVNE